MAAVTLVIPCTDGAFRSSVERAPYPVNHQSREVFPLPRDSKAIPDVLVRNIFEFGTANVNPNKSTCPS